MIPSRKKKPAAAPARRFEPGVFIGTVIATTDNYIFIDTVAGPLRLPRKNSPTRYARGQRIEFQIAIVANAVPVPDVTAPEV